MSLKDWLFSVVMVGVAAALCVAAVVLFVLFAVSDLDQNALQSAKPCSIPTRSQYSTCLSDFQGHITSRTDHYKSPSTLAISLEGFTADVGYACYDSPPGACDGIKFEPGTALVTEWWKGTLIRLGAAETRAEVITDQNPSYQLRMRTGYLAFAFPGVMLLVFGLLRWQAPTDIRRLLDTGSSSRREVWRVAIGYQTFAFMAWIGLWVATIDWALITTQEQLVPLVLAVSGMISLGVGGVVASLRLERRLSSARHATPPAQA